MDWAQVGPFTMIRRFNPDDPIRVLNADEVAIGNWTCNLKDRTFHGSSTYPNADRHRINEVDGVFERDAQGRWLAKVTRSMSGG